MAHSSLYISDALARAHRCLWYGIAALLAVNVLLIAYWDFSVHFAQGIGDKFILLLLTLAFTVYHRFICRNDRYVLMGSLMLQSIFGSAAMLMWNYLSSRFNFPFIDEALIAFDHALGFDWQAVIAWNQAHPWFAVASSAAYVSFMLMPLILLLTLCYYQHLAHAQRMLLISFMTGLATTTCAAFFPAVAGFAYYDMDPNRWSWPPVAGIEHMQTLMGLRDGSITSLTYPPIGLITFPSFHATMAIILMYAALPLRRFRWFIVPLNLLMLISCITDGGHWLADVVAGVALALAGIWLGEKILPRQERFAAAIEHRA